MAAITYNGFFVRCVAQLLPSSYRWLRLRLGSSRSASTEFYHKPFCNKNLHFFCIGIGADNAHQAKALHYAKRIQGNIKKLKKITISLYIYKVKVKEILTGDEHEIIGEF